jgi:hypothetical protein
VGIQDGGADFSRAPGVITSRSRLKPQPPQLYASRLTSFGTRGCDSRRTQNEAALPEGEGNLIARSCDTLPALAAAEHDPEEAADQERERGGFRNHGGRRRWSWVTTAVAEAFFDWLPPN